MKRKLTMDDALAAVWGGAILGGGGGGFVEPGEQAARLVMDMGTPQLWSIDELSPEAQTATVALVGAPGARNPLLVPAHLKRSLELLQKELPAPLGGFYTCENGAEATLNGWMQSAATGLPVIDLACNCRAHPSSVMGSMGLHRQAGYVGLHAYAGGRPELYVEGVVRGSLDGTSSIVRHASVQAGGAVAVARNPVPMSYAARHGSPGAISLAIDLGRAYLDGGLGAAMRFLDGSLVAEGTVVDYSCQQVAGLDHGKVRLDDAAQTELLLINEYMLLEQRGQRVAAFPDLLTTFNADGLPVASADVKLGDRLRVLRAPASRMPLAATMFMPELYTHLEVMLGKSFAPAAATA